jgi:prepilin-type N-terminal cleavage/methylation domain-containing protein
MLRRGHHSPGGMTLIELILVMALLATILAVTAPSLEGFFGGRSVAGQARRLIELTRYGRDEAISVGIPMNLWINTEKGLFGLAAATGYGIEAPKPVTFSLDTNQKFDLGEEQQQAENVQGTIRHKSKEGTQGIIFLPDGRIEEGSLETILVIGKKNETLTIRRIKDEDGNIIGSKFEVVKESAKDKPNG